MNEDSHMRAAREHDLATAFDIEEELLDMAWRHEEPSSCTSSSSMSCCEDTDEEHGGPGPCPPAVIVADAEGGQRHMAGIGREVPDGPMDEEHEEDDLPDWLDVPPRRWPQRSPLQSPE